MVETWWIAPWNWRFLGSTWVFYSIWKQFLWWYTTLQWQYWHELICCIICIYNWFIYMLYRFHTIKTSHRSTWLSLPSQRHLTRLEIPRSWWVRCVRLLPVACLLCQTSSSGHPNGGLFFFWSGVEHVMGMWICGDVYYTTISRNILYCYLAVGLQGIHWPTVTDWTCWKATSKLPLPWCEIEYVPPLPARPCRAIHIYWNSEKESRAKTTHCLYPFISAGKTGQL